MCACTDTCSQLRVRLLASSSNSQSPETRLVTAKALHALLDPQSATYGGEAAIDAFLENGGPSILRYRLDSMDGLPRSLHVHTHSNSQWEPLKTLAASIPTCAGDWMGEARNGTTDLIDTIARMPGIQKTCVYSFMVPGLGRVLRV